MAIDDGVKFMALGIAKGSVWFVDTSATFLPGTPVSVNTTGGYNVYQLRKYAADSLVFYVNGTRGGAMLYATLPLTGFPTTAPRIQFGNRSITGASSGNWDYVLLRDRHPHPVRPGGPRPPRRARRASSSRWLVATLLGAGAGCRESTSPDHTMPPVVFASRAAGASAIFRASGDSVIRLSAPDADDGEPRCAAGRIVFTSRRDGDAEVYVADLELRSAQRLTTNPGFDGEPALDAAGAAIAFVSGRTGTPRIWLMDADGANARALATGSGEFVPERNPVWSPSGDRIAFTSTRTGTSQVYVVPRGGGTAVQLSHESTGAFDAAWTPDGVALLYTSLVGTPSIRRVPAAGGPSTEFVTDPRGLGEVSCAPAGCVAILDPLGAAFGIAAVGDDGARVLVAGARDHRHPSLVTP
jgi:hypothetical protein